MATYVLVGGAWLGGWVWQEVAKPLREQGHVVYPVTLTGLGEREHLGGAETNLETHITDVVNLLRFEDLTEVVLVGHSYAGFVVPGVADRVGDRLSHVVYLDSFPASDGMAMVDFFPPDALAGLQQVVDEQGDGWRLPFPGFAQLGEQASVAGLDDAAGALLDAKAVGQPFQTWVQPLRLTQADVGNGQQVAIVCDDLRDLIANEVPMVQAVLAPPWRTVELATGHWPMLSAPADVARVLDDLGREGRG
jgi:pimeloyl-ACP methyl ester carboxylesterase